DAAISEIKKICTRYGIQSVTERENIEPLFWGVTPGLEPPVVRKRDLTNFNVAALLPLATVGEGLERCSWGNMPVTKFLTQAANTEYRFVFHAHDGLQAKGHTLIIGPSDSGKTTVTNFLLSQSLRYPALKVYCFDRMD